MPSNFKLGSGTLRVEMDDGTVFEGEAIAMELNITEELISVASFGPDEYIRQGLAGAPTAIEANFTLADLEIHPPQNATTEKQDQVEELREAIRVIRFRRQDD